MPRFTLQRTAEHTGNHRRQSNAACVCHATKGYWNVRGAYSHVIRSQRRDWLGLLVAFAALHRVMRNGTPFKGDVFVSPGGVDSFRGQAVFCDEASCTACFGSRFGVVVVEVVPGTSSGDATPRSILRRRVAQRERCELLDGRVKRVYFV